MGHNQIRQNPSSLSEPEKRNQKGVENHIK